MNDLDIIDAEVVITASEVRESIDRAKAGALTFWREVQWQVENEAWTALGYESLDQFWDAEYMALNVGIARSDRPELVLSFRKAGQTQQEIARKLNVDQKTVSNDLAKVNRNFPNEVPETVTNSRGQERPATYRKPEPPRAVNTDTGEVIDKATGEIVPSAAERQAAHDAIAREANAIENVAHMTDTLRRLSALRTPEYRARLIANNTAYPDHEDPAYVKHFNPQGIRDLADLLNTLATEMENAS